MSDALCLVTSDESNKLGAETSLVDKKNLKI